jgi:hypothetical protein
MSYVEPLVNDLKQEYQTMLRKYWASNIVIPSNRYVYGYPVLPPHLEYEVTVSYKDGFPRVTKRIATNISKQYLEPYLPEPPEEVRKQQEAGKEILALFSK